MKPIEQKKGKEPMAKPEQEIRLHIPLQQPMTPQPQPMALFNRANARFVEKAQANSGDGELAGSVGDIAAAERRANGCYSDDCGLEAVEKVLAIGGLADFTLPNADDFKRRLDGGKAILTKADRAVFASFAKLHKTATTATRYAWHKAETQDWVKPRAEWIWRQAEMVFAHCADELSKIDGAGRLAFGFRNLAEADNPESAVKALLAEADRFSADWCAGIVKDATAATEPPTGGAEATQGATMGTATPATDDNRCKGAREPIPANCYQTQKLLAMALWTTPKNISVYIKHFKDGKGYYPKSFVWPFPKDNPQLLEAVKEELKTREAELKAIALAREKGLVPRKRGSKNMPYNETLAAHNPKPPGTE